MSTYKILSKLLQITDSQSLSRSDNWKSGWSKNIPSYPEAILNSNIRALIKDVETNPATKNIPLLLETSENDFKYIVEYANDVQSQIHGSDISFVINRNINYTNICSFKCNF